jgi:peptidyl-prolyl cis-trans isomerase A (cyclophilin A)
MLRRTLLALAAAFAVSAAHAQTPAPAPAAPPAPAAKPNPKVKIETPEGAIVLELYADKAPITVANYLRYVDSGRFNGATFYRTSKPDNYDKDDYGVVQGGLQNDPKKLFAPIAHEPTSKTGIKHLDGTISMGRRAPGSATADWFITVGAQDYLDASAKDPGFAAFGHVVEGMEVVRKILMLPRDPVKGEGVMKGEYLAKPVRIIKVSRVPVT